MSKQNNLSLKLATKQKYKNKVQANMVAKEREFKEGLLVAFCFFVSVEKYERRTK